MHGAEAFTVVVTTDGEVQAIPGPGFTWEHMEALADATLAVRDAVSYAHPEPSRALLRAV